MLKKILFSLVIIFTYSNLYASVERLSFGNIQDIYICYENTNFHIARLPSREILEQENFVLRYFASEVIISNENKTQPSPLSISTFDRERQAIATVRNAIWYQERRPRGEIYASIVLKNSNKVACTGADQENDHTFIVEDIPANQSLTFKLKQIETPNQQDNQAPGLVPHEEGERVGNHNFGFGADRPVRIEPANNNGLPGVENPPRNFRPILTPKEEDPEVSSSSDTKTEDPGLETNKVTPVSENDSLITKATGNQVEGCSLQKNSQIPSASWISLIILFLIPTLIRIKQSILR